MKKNKSTVRVSLFAVLIAMILTLNIFSIGVYAAPDDTTTVVSTEAQTSAPAGDTAPEQDPAPADDTTSGEENTPADDSDAESTDEPKEEKGEEEKDSAKDDKKADDKKDDKKKDEENKTEFKATEGGFLNTIAIPFGWIIRMLDKISPTYIITLLFFAIVMKVVLFPFGIKQQKNSMKQAALRPKETAIRKKYAGRTDKVTQQKMQQEVMELYQKENFNPMGGCLPLLLQMPILFALFQVVYNPLRHILTLSAAQINSIAANLQNAGVTIKNAAQGYDLYVLNAISEKNFDIAVKGVDGLKGKLDSVADLPDLNIFGISLGTMPSEAGFLSAYILIPILTFVIVYGTTILTKKLTYQPQLTGDAKTSGCIMDWAMPLMSAWFAWMFPAVLGIYWMFQNLLGVLQQLVLKKIYPLPVFTEEDYAQAEKELFGRDKAAKKKKPGNYKRHPNSLHHIDDDDDDIPPRPAAPRKVEPKQVESASNLIEPAPLKDDDFNDNN